MQQQETVALSTANHAVGDAPVAEECCGYKFTRCLEDSLLGETWETARSDGNHYLAHVLPANEEADRAADFLNRLRHDMVPPIEVFLRRRRPVVLVTARVRTLRDRFRECWERGLPGILKKELLDYLHAVAVGLDDLLKAERVQHLDLRPETLLLQGEKVYLSGFGLMHHLWVPVRQRRPVPFPRYAAPELLQPHISSRCDQYSLALIYTEMLTGVYPLRHQRDLRRCQWLPPDLSLLASSEREIVARALSVSPSQRYHSNSEFIETLRKVEPGNLRSSPALERVVEVTPAGAVSTTLEASGSLDYLVSEMLLSIGAPQHLCQHNKIRYKLEPGRLLEHHCAVRLFPGGALLKLEGFRQHWQAQRVHQDEGILVFRLSLPVTFWQKLIGRSMGLEIQIQVAPTTFAAAHRSEVVVLIRPYGCSGKTAVKLLNEAGPKILESLRTYLQAQAEQRHSERLPCNEKVRLLPVLSELELAEPIECITKDISTTGIGFFLSKLPPTSQVYIHLPTVPEVARFAGLAEIVRSQPCGEGWFEVGARFANRK